MPKKNSKIVEFEKQTENCEIIDVETVYEYDDSAEYIVTFSKKRSK